MKKAVIISCFNWYHSRLRPVRALLMGKGYEVTVLIADFEHINHTPVQYKFPECTYIMVPEYKKNLSVRRIRSHLVFSKKADKVIRQIKPDLIYCQIPPNNAAKRCAAYKRKHSDVKLIYDIIDLWPESMPLGRLQDTLPAKKWKSWRDKSLALADHVFTECGLYREKLKDVLLPEKTSTLYLCKKQTEEEKALVEEIVNAPKTDAVLRFAYLGSMNNIIDITGICRVLKTFIARGNDCELHAIGDGESKTRFEEEVSKTGCKAYFYGRIYEETEKIRILAPCDYAFNMMKGEVSVGLTTKSMDYLSYGLPLINSIKGDTWTMIEEDKIGINADSEGKIKKQETIDRKDIIDYFDRHFSSHAQNAALISAFSDLI